MPRRDEDADLLKALEPWLKSLKAKGYSWGQVYSLLEKVAQKAADEIEAQEKRKKFKVVKGSTSGPQN
jgi:hypothetical protein